MDLIFNAFPTIGCIAVICYLIGETVKCTPLPTKFIPIIVSVCGAILGCIGKLTGMVELVDMGYLEVIATGICSGLAASGAYSLYKNLTNTYPDNNLSKAEQNLLDEDK